MSMAMPDYVQEHSDFGRLSRDERITWFSVTNYVVAKGGCTYFRNSINHPVEPTRALVEGWTASQDPYRMVPVQWQGVDRRPPDSGVISAMCDTTRVPAPTPRELDHVQAAR
jgi:hypothetical protein